MPISHVENIDCMIAMQKFPNQFFELAIVDPPYGIGAENHAGSKENGWKQWDKKEWDAAIPQANYFSELFRISKSQIIWGGNYMTQHLPASMGWIVWDKGQRDFSLADGELAWSSFEKAMRIFSLARANALQEGKIHPTQKPVKLYRWLLKNYAKPNDKILDTHLGSGSSRIAAYKMGFDFYGYEIDSDYFEAQEKRFKTAIAEPLFESVKAEQQSFFNQ